MGLALHLAKASIVLVVASTYVAKALLYWNSHSAALELNERSTAKRVCTILTVTEDLYMKVLLQNTQLGGSYKFFWVQTSPGNISDCSDHCNKFSNPMTPSDNLSIRHAVQWKHTPPDSPTPHSQLCMASMHHQPPESREMVSTCIYSVLVKARNRGAPPRYTLSIHIYTHAASPQSSRVCRTHIGK